MSAADSGKVKLIRFDEALLDHYFTSENFLFKGKQSIANLVRYYNELRAEMAAPPKSKYPTITARNLKGACPGRT